MAKRKIIYNKLVRDRIPDVIRKKGTAFRVSKLTKARFRKELLAKVGEEASALPGQTDKAEIVSELGDILDVIKAIQQEFRITPAHVRAARKAALKKKGWFRKRVFLHWVEDDGYKTNERRNVQRR